MKILTVMGTRPEIIRLSRVIEKLDRFSKHILVHTGQNYDFYLQEIFFGELGVRRPDHLLEVRGRSFAEQVARIVSLSEEVLKREQPDRVLILGDTNSGLSAFVAKRLGIPVLHMEAGNRCYDDRVPEEVNRRLIDHSSDILLPYTERSRANLLREGIENRRIFVTGNPIFEVLKYHETAIEESKILSTLGLDAGNYFLLTAHREETVDVVPRLRALFDTLRALSSNFQIPLICSIHPRTRRRLEESGLETDGDRIRFFEPFGFLDFVKLEKNARVVLTDSGTVQEECCILGIPCVTLREVTERPETLECGSNILAGVRAADVLRCVRRVTEEPGDWIVPLEYRNPNVSETVVNIALGACLEGTNSLRMSRAPLNKGTETATIPTSRRKKE